ncbi:dynein axonemal intermediate chain 7 isoform X2 [Eupeodes corollae]|uniref:dynein axonemal intermediate chain 7 isoform X2 n=1 Tax=Eupeodes corollae TaxID=290404 RepID=UPI00248F9E4B|nr:dynein axonemal intermediate chain 7 isoform X2 [Eupeodes corollae]
MPPKKKLSKKEKARLEAEQAELLRIELEKEKLKKVEEERQRKQIEREQAEKRLQVEILENKERRQQLKSSMAYFNDIRLLIDTIKQNEKENNEWDKFMRCNGLPNANSPSDLRKYIHMWKVDIKCRHQEERNWLLKTNERTLLTQDSNVADLSRTNLRRQQGNLGDLYAGRIEEVLGILAEVDDSIGDLKQSITTVTDLNKLKAEIRDFLRDYLDEFTYKILSHVERDMEPDRPGVSKHTYISNVFKSQVWTIAADAHVNPKDVKAKIDENRHTEIEFPVIDMQITLPPSVKVNNCAFRGLWLNYDHFSDYCPTFRLLRHRKEHLNILLQSKKEWKKRKEILQSMLDEASEELPISDFDPNSVSDEPTAPREIDIDKIYNDYEDEQNKARRKDMGLNASELGEYDVNLRKYRIIGGVFVVDYLEQPQQDKRLNTTSFTRTIISPSKLTRKPFRQSYKPPPPPLPGVRRLPEEIEAEMRLIEASLDKLGSVTVELPNSVIWFEPPIACRWETAEETIQFENEEKLSVPISSTSLVRVQTNDDTLVKSGKKGNNTLKKSNNRKYSYPYNNLNLNLNCQLPERHITDFNMYNIPNGLDIYGLLEDYVVPRLPEGYSIQMECNTNDVKPKVTYLFLARNICETSESLQGAPNKIPIPITQSILDTGSPREYYPRFNFKKSVHIIPPKDEDVGEKGVDEHRDHHSDKNQGSYPCNDVDDMTKGAKPSAYMFSQLLEDLDRLCDEQIPCFNKPDEQPSSSVSSLTGSEIGEGVVLIGQLTPEQSAGRKLSACILTQDFQVTPPMAMVVKSSAEENYDDGNPEEKTESSSEYEDDEDLSKQLIGDPSNNGNQYCKEDIPRNSFITVGKWSLRDIHDTKFNEDKLAIQFRAGCLGTFGFAMNRYCNMPYQTWELKPDQKITGAIQFSFTASIISMDMSITSGGYCVNSFQGGTTDTITKMVGKILSLAELKSILIKCAVDIFPDEDAFCYTEGSCEKNFVMEMHLYACMSTLALSHNFGWSRWNLLAGSRTAVLLMRELVENKKVPNHSTLQVTPLRTAIIDCTEVSACFNPVPAQGMGFYADLYQLSKVHLLPSSREKQISMDPVLRDNIAQILMAIRPLSFC